MKEVNPCQVRLRGGLACCRFLINVSCCRCLERGCQPDMGQDGKLNEGTTGNGGACGKMERFVPYEVGSWSLG